MAIDELRLTVAGMSAKDRMVVRSLLNLASGRAEYARWRLLESGDGDVCVIDVDSEQGHELWEEAQKTTQTLIAFTRNKRFDAPVKLSKPLRSREFLGLLDRLSSSLDDEPTPLRTDSTQADVADSTDTDEDLDAESGSDVTTANWPALTLADHLRLMSWTSPIALTQPGWPVLLVDPGSGAWFYDGPISDLEPELFQRPIPASVVQPLSVAELVERVRGHRQRPLSELKWFAGLAQMPGKLHPGLKGDVQFMLAQIPGEAMQHEELHQLARTLLRGPMDLAELVAVSGQPEANVAAFLNASFASGKLLINRDWKVRGF